MSRKEYIGFERSYLKRLLQMRSEFNTRYRRTFNRDIRNTIRSIRILERLEGIG